MSLLLALTAGGGSPDITVAASGVSGTGQVGNLAPQITLAITGNQATTALGTLVEGDAPILASVSATGQVGTATPSITVPLTGTVGTGNVGSFAPKIDVLALNNVANTSLGTLGVKIDLPITGNQSTGQVGTLTVAAGADITVSATGVNGTGQIGSFNVELLIGLAGVQALSDIGILSLDSGIAPSVGGYDNKKPKKKYIVKVGERLLVFKDKATALQALPTDEVEAELITKQAIEKAQQIPDKSYDYQSVLDKVRNETELQNYLQSQDYYAILELYERALTDEEDIELLLMGM